MFYYFLTSLYHLLLLFYDYLFIINCRDYICLIFIFYFFFNLYHFSYYFSMIHNFDIDLFMVMMRN